MKQAVILFLSLLLFSVPAFAKDGGSDHSGRGDGESRVKIEIKAPENENELENEANEVHLQLNVNNQTFELRGIVTAMVGNNFTVLGQTIFIDPTQVRKFEQRGALTVGSLVKVEGNIVNRVKFAREIKVQNIPGEASIATSSLTLQTNNSPLPQTTNPFIRFRIDARGPLDQLNSLIQQITSFLTHLI